MNKVIELLIINNFATIFSKLQISHSLMNYELGCERDEATIKFEECGG